MRGVSARAVGSKDGHAARAWAWAYLVDLVVHAVAPRTLLADLGARVRLRHVHAAAARQHVHVQLGVRMRGAGELVMSRHGHMVALHRAGHGRVHRRPPVAEPARPGHVRHRVAAWCDAKVEEGEGRCGTGVRNKPRGGGPWRQQGGDVPVRLVVLF